MSKEDSEEVVVSSTETGDSAEAIRLQEIATLCEAQVADARSDGHTTRKTIKQMKLAVAQIKLPRGS